MQPNTTPRRNKSLVKTCAKCNATLGVEEFCYTKNLFFADNLLPVCNKCIEEQLVAENFNWKAVDKLCQYADIPFVPKEFVRLHQINGDKVFPIYAQIFSTKEFEGLNWLSYYEEFKELEAQGYIKDEIPLVSDEIRRKLQKKWGGNYDDEALNYLEDLLNGLYTTQNINGKLQDDQAIKICKISYEIDSRIREGQDFDKMLASYDKLVKVAEFTPKNVKNASDFDSTGELVRWLEKGGWKNKFYDNVTRDIVDETIKNIQSWNQRLYTNESGIGEEITKRIEALNTAALRESYYDAAPEYDIDEYEVDGYDKLLNEEFKVDLDGED